MRTIAALICSAGPPVVAQDRVHTVLPGDNLYDLAQRFLDDPRQWPQLQRLNHVTHPRRLKPGSQLVIPAALARPAPAAADVLHAAGQVSVQGHAQARAMPLAAGEIVVEGAWVDVGDGGFLTLRLADGSVVRLAGGTKAQLRELRHVPASGRVQSGILLERGRVDATVIPLRTPRSRFEVQTPRAVGGVRGTTFGVSVGEGGDFIGDVREGAIHVRPTTAPQTTAGGLVRAGEGTRVGAASGVRITVAPLLAAPDLSEIPAVVEDISLVELPLSRDTGASAWQVRIASDEAAERVVRNATFQQPVARFAGLDDGHYLVSVRAIDGRGIPGTEAVRSLMVNARPQAPLLREPRPGSRVPPSGIELLCTEGTGVQGYRFEVARDTAFDDLVTQTTDIDQCRHTVQALPPGPYLWRVASVTRDTQGQRDQGPFSQPVAFRVVALPPVPAAPNLRSESSTSLSVAWGASPGGPWRHQIQIAHDEAFTRLLDDQQLAEPSFRRSLPPAGTYHLRVRQIDADGLAGAWTEPQRLELRGHAVTTTDAQPLISSEGLPVLPGTR
jgi:hypothetical protein